LIQHKAKDLNFPYQSQYPTSTIFQASSTVCSTRSLQHVCKPCFLCCRTNYLQFTVRWFLWDPAVD